VRETLERVGLIVVSLGKVGTGAIDSVTEIFRTIRSVNLVIEGDTKRADTLIGRIAEEIVTIEGTVLDRFKPTVAILYPTGEQPPFAAGRGTPENEIVLRAGGINIFPMSADYKQVSFEEIVKRDPSVIFTGPAAHPLDHPESLPPRSESRAREARLRDQGVAVGQLAHRPDDQDRCGLAASESVTSPPAPLTSP
jgi:hypothetical protein